MFELLKIAGVSAVLSAGFVTASEMQPQPAPEAAGAKIYNDRVPEGETTRFSHAVYTVAPQDGDAGLQTRREGKGDALGKAQGCASQAWPHIAPECLGEGRPARGVRMITVEQRQGANISVLVRVPASDPTRH
ncbi:MAG: hypothetical protein M3158_02750 [Pseudomonadota bacterium]|nr:hypothetical protein [Pseudomonadota bacterium]